MGSINVLHINAEMNWGGGETQTYYLIQALKDRGYRQSVACQPESALAKRCTKDGIPVHLVRMPTQFSLSAVIRLRHILQAEKFQLIHFHTSRAHTIGVLASLGIPALSRIVTRRMEHRTGGWLKVIFLYNRGVDKVVAISESVRQVLLKAGARNDKVSVIPSAVEVDNFRSGERQLWRDHFRFAMDDPVVGVVGSLTWRKGIEILLQAAPSLFVKHPNCRILLVGDGPLRQHLVHTATQLGISHNVLFAGHHEDVAGILAAIDIFVLPSLREGLGVAVLEAMAAARPVVASRVGGIPESVIDGETGFLVPPGDHEALSRSIIRLLDDPPLREQFGKAGREQVEAKFSVEAMVQQYEALYQELLSAACH
jgi:glycosyltransferase involved in cell wall biosynthesis